MGHSRLPDMNLAVSSFLFFLSLLVGFVLSQLPDFYEVYVTSSLCRHVLAQYGRRSCAAVLKGFEILRRRVSLPARSAPGPSMWKGFGHFIWKGSGPGTTQFHVLAQSGSWKTCFLGKIVSLL